MVPPEIRKAVEAVLDVPVFECWPLKMILPVVLVSSALFKDKPVNAMTVLEDIPCIEIVPAPPIVEHFPLRLSPVSVPWLFNRIEAPALVEISPGMRAPIVDPKDSIWMDLELFPLVVIEQVLGRLNPVLARILSVAKIFPAVENAPSI